MKKIKQTKEQLLLSLKEHLKFLINSSKSYDNGFESEAKRMSVSLRILLHDTMKSKSILSQLGLKNKILFFDTSHPYDPSNLVSHSGLAAMRFQDFNAKYIPKFHSEYTITKKEFNKWWQSIIIVDQNKNIFNRQKLILSLSNKDGGAHVDPELDEDYNDLVYKNSMGWKAVYSDGREEDLKSIHFASIRQITYEVIDSLKEFNSNFFD